MRRFQLLVGRHDALLHDLVDLAAACAALAFVGTDIMALAFSCGRKRLRDRWSSADNRGKRMV